MKQLIVMLFSFIITLMCSLKLDAQWYEKSNGLPDNWRANAIDAYDSLIATGPYSLTSAWIPDSLYITTDGGNNWNPKPLPNTLDDAEFIFDISIIGEDKIWFCTRKEGRIYNTTDGGFNWELQFWDGTKTEQMSYIEMFDSLNGIAMGKPPADKPALFLKTTNGGIDWISQNDSSLISLPSFEGWRTVDFVDINTGYFFPRGGSPNKLYKTITSGKNWEVFNDTIVCSILKAYDENIFLCQRTHPFYNSGFIYRTLDAGNNWEFQILDNMGQGYDIEYIPGNPSGVWLTTGALSFSSDTGKTWVEEFRSENSVFSDIVFTDENYGWILEDFDPDFQIYRTTNGGFGGIVSVDDNSKDLRLEKFILKQNYPNPFNPTTIIKYQTPELSYVTIIVYDVLGNEIAILVNEEKPAGEYEVGFDGTGLTSGIYFYQLRAGDYTETKKMILLR
jgi:photosystem II stability/assembly factor-like uncharacterized protein